MALVVTAASAHGALGARCPYLQLHLAISCNSASNLLADADACHNFSCSRVREGQVVGTSPFLFPDS